MKRVESAWHWQTEGEFPYLVCQLLQDWKHGFFTQQCWPNPPGQLTQTLSTVASVYRVKQVHGNGVLATDGINAVTPEAEKNPDFDHADALISTGPEQAVWVCSADCTPALIGDVRTGQVSAIHAGWRGTAARIIPEAIAKLQAQGSQLTDLRVALGPAIAGEVYQVAESVAAQTGRSLVDLDQASSDGNREHSGTPSSEAQDTAVLAQLSTMQSPPILPDPEPGKVKLDVRQVNVLQLRQLGLRHDQISVAPHCTYQEPEHFFSYRRTGEKKVQWSGIVSQK